MVDVGLADQGHGSVVSKDGAEPDARQPAQSRIAPIGLSTDIIWTANARTLRHVIEMRTAPGAEEELRLIFDQVAQIMQREAPGLFQDFARADDGSWVPEFHKV